MVKQIIEIQSWASILGKWDFENGRAIYTDPHDTHNPYGIAIGDIRFTNGTIETIINLNDKPQDNVGRIIFGYNSGTRNYYSAGIGGYEFQYVFDEFDSREGWRPLGGAGNKINILANTDYRLEVSLKGQNFSLNVNGVKVIEQNLHHPLEGDQVGLFALGPGPVKFTQLKIEDFRNPQIQRFYFLKHLYDRTNEFYATKAKSSSTIFMVDPAEIGAELGFTPIESERIAQFLSQEGLVKYVTQSAIRIEHLGNKAVEAALTNEAMEIKPKEVEGENSMRVTPFFRLPRKPTEESDIFVLMPFRTDLKPVYADHIKKVAEELTLTVTRGDDFFTARSVMEDIWDAICAARIVIADCTGRNPNVFYELGIAHTVGKPVILITQSTDDVPFDIRHIRFIHYEFTPRGMKEFEEKLAKTLKKLDNELRGI